MKYQMDYCYRELLELDIQSRVVIPYKDLQIAFRMFLFWLLIVL